MPTSTNFAPNSYFFTDPTAITQDSGQAFGPVSADEFQLTSKFSLASDTDAYAICTDTHVGSLTNFNSQVVSGANGSYAEADLTQIIKFTCDVASNTISYRTATSGGVHQRHDGMR